LTLCKSLPYMSIVNGPMCGPWREPMNYHLDRNCGGTHDPLIPEPSIAALLGTK
jgi:hypothetical protein